MTTPRPLRLAILWGLAAALPAAAETIAFVGATIHPVSGADVANGVLVVDGARITAVGAGVAPPAGARVVDVAGKHLYPGFVHSGTPLGISEISSVRGTQDEREIGDLNAALRAEVAFNADSQLLPPTVAGGVLAAHVAPGGGIVSGTSAVMRPHGWNWEDMTIKSPIGMHLSYPRVARRVFPWTTQSEEDFKKEKEKALKSLDDIFDAADAYRRAQRAADDGKGPAVDRNPSYAALVPVLENTLPLFVHAPEQHQITGALDWLKKRGLTNFVLVTGPDAQYLAARLARERVPVILDGVLDLPARSWEPYDAVYAAAAKLHAAGVRFAIGDGGGDASNARNLPFHAAMAAAFGLPKDVALRSITLTAAEILGVGERLGSLEAGKDANLLVTDGDPLEIRTRIERVFVAGEEIDLTQNRQFQLYQRYDSRPQPGEKR
jgi:imidazolonepropionase-like amidohydrolase